MEDLIAALHLLGVTEISKSDTIVAPVSMRATHYRTIAVES